MLSSVGCSQRAALSVALFFSSEADRSNLYSIVLGTAWLWRSAAVLHWGCGLECDDG
jgi:hypothetical protein